MITQSVLCLALAFADLHISTQATAHDLGLAFYPGAHPKSDPSKDHNSSNLNFAFSNSSLGLKIVVQKFDSNDSMERVVRFYEKELSRYGKVEKCGAPNSQACEDSDGEYKIKLKTGPENNQRVVAVRTQGTGSSFVLVHTLVRE